MPVASPADAAVSTFSPYMFGAIFTLTLVAALLFFRFYFRTRDILFLFFACSFFLQAGTRLMAIAFHDSPDAQASIYTLRVISYGLILFAIFHKNRNKRLKTFK